MKIRRFLAIFLAAVMALSVAAPGAKAASSAEIQSQIDAVYAK